MSDITIRTLQCGMPVVLETVPGVRSVGLTWLIPAGTATEPPDRQGLAALWAELLHRGAGERDSRRHADALDRLGVSCATEVGTHHVRLSATLLGERLLEALEVIRDMVVHPRMDPQAIEPTRALALQALEALRDDPAQRASEAARSRHFPVPLNRCPQGTREGLMAATRQDLVEGWRLRACPEGSILALAGALEIEPVVRRLDDLLHHWRGRAPAFIVGDPPPRGYAHEESATHQVQIVLMHDAPPERDEESVRERAVAAALSGGMSGRLFSEVREKRGLCYAVHASYAAGKETGSVTAYVGTTPERAQESLDVLWAELNRINGPGGGLSSREFQRAVVGLKSRLIFAGESTGARAASLAFDLHRLGRPRSLAEIAARIDALTLDEINDYLHRRRLGTVTIQTLGPRSLRPPA